MKLPEFVTPNFITVMRLLFVPVGAYTLFKNGGDVIQPGNTFLGVCFSSLE